VELKVFTVKLVYDVFQPKILTFCGLALYVSHMKKVMKHTPYQYNVLLPVSN
jgi:hypothetical protein